MFIYIKDLNYIIYECGFEIDVIIEKAMKELYFSIIL